MQSTHPHPTPGAYVQVNNRFDGMLGVNAGLSQKNTRHTGTSWINICTHCPNIPPAPHEIVRSRCYNCIDTWKFAENSDARKFNLRASNDFNVTGWVQRNGDRDDFKNWQLHFAPE